jgi:hypothetical protein
VAPTPTRASVDLYLDLMKRVLTRTGFIDAVQLRATGWKRWGLGPVQHALASRGYALVQRDPQGSPLPWGNRASPCETILSIPRLDAIQQCVDSVLTDDVPGDLIEVGVWRGGGSIFLRAVLAAYDVRDRRVWVADSFEGFPDQAHRDPADRAVDYAAGLGDDFFAVDLATVRANFERYGLLDDQVMFLKGWFHETLPATPIDRLALVQIDGDLYGSTRDALDALYPKLSVGGFLVVDDYGTHEQCRRAVDEYRAAQRVDEPIRRVGEQMVLWRRES